MDPLPLTEQATPELEEQLMTMTLTLSQQYQQVVAIAEADLTLTPEQQQAVTSTRSAFLAAREQAEVAERSRKDKAAKVEAARNLVDVTKAAYEAAQVPESEAERERYLAAIVKAEELWARMAAIALGTTTDELVYINSVPTDEKRLDYYGTEETVWRTTADTLPIPTSVRAFEFGNIRIRLDGRTPTEFSFDVQLLKDEFVEGTNVRDDVFGHHARVFGRRPYQDEVEVALAGGSRTLSEAETMVAVFQTAIRLGHIVEEAAKA